MFITEKDLAYNFNKQFQKAQISQPYSAAYVADSYLYGLGVEKNVEAYLLALKNAANYGDARASIQIFFIALKNGDVESAISFLSECVRKKRGGSSIAMLYAEKLLELISENRMITVNEVFSSFNEEDDEYLIGLCYLYGYGCERNIIKASKLLCGLCSKQINNFNEVGALAIYYPVQILLIHCLLCIYGESDENIKEQEKNVATLIAKVALSGDFSVAEDEDVFNDPNMRAGFYELTLINFREINKFRKDLCIRYCLDLINEGEKDYPTYNDIIEEAIDIAEKGEDVKDILVLVGQNADDNSRVKSGELLVKYGYDAAGYSVLAGVYDDNENFIEALNYLNLWADANSYDEMCLSSTAQYYIGLYYFNGKGVTKDLDKSFEWWIKAADNGNEKASEMVQIAYDAGNGNLRAGIESIKREDSGEPAKASGGCYVATCVYGSYDCPEVWTLRRFRDYYLSKTWYGRAFIKLYYSVSPLIVKLFGKFVLFKKLWKPILDKMVISLNEKGYESTKYEDCK